MKKLIWEFQKEIPNVKANLYGAIKRSNIKGWKKVFAGGYESLALKDDGTLWDLRTLEIIKNPNNIEIICNIFSHLIINHFYQVLLILQ